MNKVLGYIERAQQDGATLACGGHRITDPAGGRLNRFRREQAELRCSFYSSIIPVLGAASLTGGFYVEPTIFTEVSDCSELAMKEVFGPVLSLFR